MSADLLPEFPFRSGAHDRLSERRRDEDFLADAWSDPGSRVLVVRGGELAATPDATALRWVSPVAAPAGQRLLLGSADGTVRFAVLTDDAAAGGAPDSDDVDSPSYAPLRRLATQLTPLEASLAVQAAALAEWHRRHPRCALCGAASGVVRAGEARRCEACGAEHFPRTDPAVIMTVVDDAGRCLLGHNRARAASWFSTLAGFVEPGESPEQAVVREVREEVGVRVDAVRYLGSQPWPFPSSLMLGFEAHAATTAVTVDGDEITEARWFTRDELSAAVGSGEVVLPTTISIAGALIGRWYGGALPAVEVPAPASAR